MKFYLAPVSLSGAVALSSTIHAVLIKDFPMGSEMVQAGWFFTCILLCLLMHFHGLYSVQGCFGL